MSKRDRIVANLANEILKTASEDVYDSPLAKTASENDIEEAIVEKVANVFVEASQIYKAAAEVIGDAENQEELARQALEENGIDPDAVIEAAEEAAIAEMEAQQSEDDEEEEEEEDEE